MIVDTNIYLNFRDYTIFVYMYSIVHIFLVVVLIVVVEVVESVCVYACPVHIDMIIIIVNNI